MCVETKGKKYELFSCALGSFASFDFEIFSPSHETKVSNRGRCHKENLEMFLKISKPEEFAELRRATRAKRRVPAEYST